MQIKPQQLRAARALLGWSQSELAGRAGIAELTVINFENGKSTPSSGTVDKLLNAVDSGGVEFTSNGGVAPRQTRVVQYVGQTEFQHFFDDVYQTAKTVGGSICLFNGVPALLTRWLGPDFYAAHAKRMAEIKDKFDFRVIVNENERSLIGSGFATYRTFPEERFNEKTVYIYGGKVAFLNFDHNTVSVTVLEQAETSDAMRVLFDIAWDNVAKEVDE